MKILKLAVRLLYKNAGLHCLLILQMILVFVVGASVVSEINGFFYQKKLIKELDNDRYAFFQSVNERDLIFSGVANEVLDNYKNFDVNFVKKELAGETVFITESNIYANSSEGIVAFGLRGFNQSFLEYISLPLSQGKWLTDVEKKENCVRFVTDCKTYDVGDEVPVVVNENGKVSELVLLVTGIAETPFYGPTSSSASTKPDASTITSEYTKSESGNYISGIICIDDIQDTIPSVTTYDYNYHVLFDENLSEPELQENIKTLKLYGNVSSGAEIMEETEKNIYDNLKLQLPKIIFISLIALVGFCGIALINISSNIPVFALYSILGCSKRTSYLILLVYVLIIETAALSPAVLLLLFSSFSDNISMYFPFVNVSTFIIIFLIGFLFFVISFSFVFVSFKKQSSRQLLIGDTL